MTSPRLAPALLSLFIFMAAGAVEDATKEYVSTPNKFSFHYPKGWSKMDAPAPQVELAVGVPNGPGLLPNLVFIVADAPAGAELKPVADGVQQGLTGNLKDPALIGSKATTLDGVAAYNFIATGVQNNQKMKVNTLVALSGGKIYLLHFTCDEESFDKYAKELSDIVKSFKLNAKQ